MRLCARLFPEHNKVNYSSVRFSLMTSPALSVSKFLESFSAENFISIRLADSSIFTAVMLFAVARQIVERRVQTEVRDSSRGQQV